MSTQYSHLPGTKSDVAEKVLQSAVYDWLHPSEHQKTARVFVTVSRRPGAGAISFSHRLARRLNQDEPGDWSAWDSELVEKVSSEFGVSKQLIQTIQDRHHNWLEELVSGFSVSRTPPDLTETRAYKRVAMTIRALANKGHAIIVGQGGAFVTEGLPQAIHLRLVAPLEHRIKCIAERDKISLHKAAAKIVEVDQRRAEFYRRYWHRKAIVPEAFTMTLNSAEMSLDELVECVVPLIRMREEHKSTGGML